MTNTHNHKRIHVWLAAILASLVLVACGGGGGASGTSEIINGILVPLAPDVASNSTVTGADANGNGVRDDVERTVAARVSSQAGFDQALEVATFLQKSLSTTTWDRTTGLANINSTLCAQNKRTEGADTPGYNELAQLTYNTQERWDAFTKMFSQVGAFDGDELQGCV